MVIAIPQMAKKKRRSTTFLTLAPVPCQLRYFLSEPVEYRPHSSGTHLVALPAYKANPAFGWAVICYLLVWRPIWSWSPIEASPKVQLEAQLEAQLVVWKPIEVGLKAH